MSSIKYSAELAPDPVLRRLVLISGALATVVGIVILAGLSLPWYWRVFGGLAWAFFSGRDLLHIASGHKGCEKLRLDNEGNVRLFSADGCCTAATIDGGSVVLPGLAWLRLRTDSGRRQAELLRRKTAGSNEWRRLQVIWRHLGAHG